MFSLKSLDILKCESRTSLHAVQYKLQTGSVVVFCIVLILRMASLEILFLCAVWDSFRGLVLFLACSFFSFFVTFALIKFLSKMSAAPKIFRKIVPSTFCI